MSITSLYSNKHRLWCQKQVSQAGISHCIPQYYVGCNYLFMPEIPASGTKVLLGEHKPHNVFLPMSGFGSARVKQKARVCIIVLNQIISFYHHTEAFGNSLNTKHLTGYYITWSVWFMAKTGNIPHQWLTLYVYKALSVKTETQAIRAPFH